MYNYLIIPKYPGYRLVIYSNLSKKAFDVNKYHEATSIIQTLGLHLRPSDKKFSTDLGLNFTPKSVKLSDDFKKLDNKDTTKSNTVIIDVAW